VAKKGSGKKGAAKQRSDSSESSPVSLGPVSLGRETKGRVVITHSTYIPGLIALLEKLAHYSQIQTITPAVISRVKSNSPTLKLKVSVPITGGYKLIARKCRSAQEVFVVTQWSKAELEQVIAQILA
jgi:hypothetical protein